MTAWAAKVGMTAMATALPETRRDEAEREFDLKAFFNRVKDQVKEHEISFLAAGLAYYGILALVPGLIATVSIFGLVADPSNVRSLIADIRDAVPAEVANFLEGQLTSIVDSSPSGLGVGAAIAIAAALWTASSGMKSLIRGINVVYGESEKRGFLQARGLALGLTLAVIVGLVLLLSGITLLPRLVDVSGFWLLLFEPVRWLVLLGATVAGLALLYRVSPTEVPRDWSIASAGAVLAALIWLIASFGLSIYTARFASFNETYGTLGAVIVILLWLYVSGFVVLLGAVIDSALRRGEQSAPPGEASNRPLATY